MKTIKPIQGQTYMGYYHNDSNEEHVIEGICRKYSDEMVLVNERGAWVPFAKLNENSYPTPPLAEDILRKAVRHYLYEDVQITKEQLIDLFENGSDAEIQTLYEATKEDITIALDALGINAEDLDDETLNAIEDAVINDELEVPEETEEVAGIPDSAQPAVESDVEETVEEQPEDSLGEELDQELELVESSNRFREMNASQFSTFLQNGKKVIQIAKLARGNNNGPAATWNWFKYLGPINMTTAHRQKFIQAATSTIEKATAAINAGKVENTEEVETYIESLRAVQQYIALGPTPEEAEEQDTSRVLTADQLGDKLILKKLQQFGLQPA